MFTSLDTDTAQGLVCMPGFRGVRLMGDTYTRSHDPSYRNLHHSSKGVLRRLQAQIRPVIART